MKTPSAAPKKRALLSVSASCHRRSPLSQVTASYQRTREEEGEEEDEEEEGEGRSSRVRRRQRRQFSMSVETRSSLLLPSFCPSSSSFPSFSSSSFLPPPAAAAIFSKSTSTLNSQPSNPNQWATSASFRAVASARSPETPNASAAAVSPAACSKMSVPRHKTPLSCAASVQQGGGIVTRSWEK